MKIADSEFMKNALSLMPLPLIFCFLGCIAPSPNQPPADGGMPETDAGPSMVDSGSTNDSDGGSSPEMDGGTADLAEGQCRAHQDCPDTDQLGAAECATPDPLQFPRGVCGACLDEPDQCQNDTECGPGLVCRGEGGCGCGQAALICVEGCQSNADCLVGQTCDEDSHCVTTTCTDASQCPTQFTCSSGTHCTRSACTIDSDCPDEGFCVLSLCFDDPGFCFQNVPVP
jgi:hypothetical protein